MLRWVRIFHPISVGIYSLVAVTACLLLSVLVAYYGVLFSLVLVGSFVAVWLIALRYDAFLITLMLAIHLYVDWYLAMRLVAVLLICVMLFSWYLFRSREYPFVMPRVMWLWLLYLMLCFPAALAGMRTLFDASVYFPNIIVGSLLACWLGMQVARDSGTLRCLLWFCTLFATLIALHSLFQQAGVFLFKSDHYDTFLANYQVNAVDATASRVGSFFIDPNWNGCFLAMIFFLPLALFIDARSLTAKVGALCAALTILLALLFTFSNGAWIAALAGSVVFFCCIQMRYRVFFVLLAAGCCAGLIGLFSAQIALQLYHLNGAGELSLRIGAWQTGWNVMLAHPISGIGLGSTVYMQAAEAYRVPAQFIPLSHPHDSYLEIGAMAGIPALLVFLALIIYHMYCIGRNWWHAPLQDKALFAGGLAAVITLSVNSISINGWTLFPLSFTAFVLLGALSSPLVQEKK